LLQSYNAVVALFFFYDCLDLLQSYNAVFRVFFFYDCYF
jgi:hypothetical protein